MLYKYPRTPHLTFSPGFTSDDEILKADNQFVGQTVLVTEKMDGENTSIYRNHIHARSKDSIKREYHAWLGNYAATFQYGLGDYRLCGEYMFAEHSIAYAALSSYFLLFSVWQGEFCLSWDDTLKFVEKLEAETGIALCTAPVLYQGVFDLNLVKTLAENKVRNGGEGIMVRNVNSFHLNEFQTNIAKYVRVNHVQTDQHWSKGPITKNKLA